MDVWEYNDKAQALIDAVAPSLPEADAYIIETHAEVGDYTDGVGDIAALVVAGKASVTRAQLAVLRELAEASGHTRFRELVARIEPVG